MTYQFAGNFLYEPIVVYIYKRDNSGTLDLVVINDEFYPLLFIEY